MAAIVLACIPFAGAGASFYSPWRGRNEHVDVLPLELPGRERRLGEPPSTDVESAVFDLVRSLSRSMLNGGDVAIFGHSLGAVLAFELARHLETYQNIYKISLRHLFVSGSPSPWSMREDRATGLSDEAFVARVQEFAGYEHPALADEELRELILPTLRADVQMHESYRAAPGSSIAAPITAVRGSDDALVTKEETAKWDLVSSSEFKLINLPGGHMYLTDQTDAILNLVGASAVSDNDPARSR